MTVLPRAATAGELTKLRSDNQSSRLYLTILNPATVYTARLDTVPTSTDSVTSITYTSGSGTLASVLADMTMYVGSTAGAYDLGIARIRKDGTTLAGTFYIAEESEINWQSSAYLTVVNDFDLWPRHIKIAADGTTPLMDYDVTYTNQNQAAGSTPFPVMGSDVVLWLDGSTVSYTPDASNSWVNGGTIASYAWTATGASATANMTTATPTITYNTTGTYRIDCAVTGDNGVSFAGYRHVFVVTESSGVVTSFTLEGDVSGDYESGGWSFRVTLFDEATLSSVKDRALVILHSRDWYGSTAGSVGYLPGSENIIAIGRIAGESIQWDVEYKPSFVSFDVQGPHYWLGQMTAFPSGVKDIPDSATPNKWTKFRGLTLNKCWYHFMMWRTTAARCMDVYPNTDTRRIKRLEAPGGQNIWSQLTEIAERSIFARPCCDRYGRIFLEINQQLLTDRSGVPTVMALTSSDWYDQISIDRTPTPRVGLVDMSGVAWDGTTPTAFFSLAPGHVFKRHGSVDVADRLALVDQTDTNALNGLYIAWKNNNYARVEIKLASNNRLIDIAPYQRVTLAVTATDTPRGIAESFSLIPRSLSLSWQNGYMLTGGTFEDEVVADLAITGDTPQTPPDPPILPVDPPVDPPPIDPPISVDAREVWVATSSGILWSSDFFTAAQTGSQPTWNAVANILTDFGANTIKQFWTSEDGSTIYILFSDTAGYPTAWHNPQTIYKCSNPKAATPTWQQILFYSSTIANNQYAYHMGAFNRYSNKLVVRVSTSDDLIGQNPAGIFYGEYNGSTWTWQTLASVSGYLSDVAYKGMLTTLNNGMRDVAHSANYNFLNADGVSIRPYRLYNGSDYYVAVKNSGVNSIHGVISNTTIFSGYTDTSTYRIITGALDGPRTTFVTASGLLYLANDGVTFASTFTWQSGQVAHAKRSGVGPLVWLASSVTANNEFIRINKDGAGVNWEAMTGNIWSLISGNQAFINLQLVY